MKVITLLILFTSNLLFGQKTTSKVQRSIPMEMHYPNDKCEPNSNCRKHFDSLKLTDPDLYYRYTIHNGKTLYSNSNSSIINYYKYHIIATKNHGDSLSINDIKIEGDSIDAIILLIHNLERANKERWAASDILRQVRTDGYVTNWKEWRKAVKRYQEIKKHQYD